MKEHNRFINLDKRYRFSRMSLIWLSIFVTFVLGWPLQTTFAASPDPQVIIATDTTPPNCVQTFVKIPDNHLLPSSTSRFPCAPGTIIGTKVVSLAQAKAMHEAYALIPEGALSLGVLEKWFDTVQNLKNAKRSELRAGSWKAIVPKSDCGETIEGSTDAWEHDNHLFVDIQWYVSSNCNGLFIDYAEMEGKSIIINTWWYQSTYGSVWGRRCPPGFDVQNGRWYHYDVNASVPSGYDFTWTLGYEYNPCISVDSPTDTIYYGPLD